MKNSQKNAVDLLLGKVDKQIADEISFPSIDFTKDEYSILQPTRDEAPCLSVEPSLCGGESSIESIIHDNESKFNLMLKDSRYEVSIFESNEYYEDEDDEDDDLECDGIPTFEAVILKKENGDEVDGSRTGRYCDISSVIDELELTVDELLDGSFSS